MLPEIILFSKLEDPLGPESQSLCSDLKRLVIIYIPHGRIQAIQSRPTTSVKNSQDQWIASLLK